MQISTPPQYYDGQRSDMLGLVPLSARRVLEVGCGRGAFAALLKARQQVEIVGVEIVEDVAQDARGVVDRIIIADIERDSLDFGKSDFDCIVLNDVLEHLRDPWAVLIRLRAQLAVGGCVVASIPNIRYFPTLKALVLQKEWKYVESGILDWTHLRFFTEKSIHALFKDSGYELVSCDGLHPMEFPWKFRLFNWILGNRFHDMMFKQFACLARKRPDSPTT